jgi:hypothetical protein
MSWFDDEARVFRLGFCLLPMADLDDALAVLTTALTAAAGARRRERCTVVDVIAGRRMPLEAETQAPRLRQ